MWVDQVVDLGSQWGARRRADQIALATEREERARLGGSGRRPLLLRVGGASALGRRAGPTRTGTLRLRERVNQLWASLIGVVLGGGMSYLAQLTTARQAARTEDKRQATQVAEARRAERLDTIREFIQLAQQGIRLAEERYEARDWSSGRTPEWLAAERALVERLWICERMILVLIGPKLYQLAWDYASAVHHVLWEDLGEPEAAWNHLRGPMNIFLNAAHEKLG